MCYQFFKVILVFFSILIVKLTESCVLQFGPSFVSLLMFLWDYHPTRTQSQRVGRKALSITTFRFHNNLLRLHLTFATFPWWFLYTVWTTELHPSTTRWIVMGCWFCHARWYSFTLKITVGSSSRIGWLKSTESSCIFCHWAHCTTDVSSPKGTTQTTILHIAHCFK